MSMLRIGLLLLFFIPSFTFAENRVGNGGGAWVCRDDANRIAWIKLIDLFEIEQEHGLTLKDFDGDYEEIAKEVEEKIEALPGHRFDQLPAFFRSVNGLRSGPHIKFVEERLPVVNDALYFLRPISGLCPKGSIHYEQIVNYVDSSKVLVQRDLFDRLTNLSKAALIVHEAVYAFRRSMGDTDSLNSRHIVGLAFANLQPSVLVWNFRFLDSNEAPVFPDHYKVRLTRISPSGRVEPIANAGVALTGEFKRRGLAETLSKRSDVHGFADFKIAGGSQLYFSSPTIQVRIGNRNRYVGHLAPNGWSNALASENAQADYSCKSATSIGKDDVHVTCVNKTP